MSFSETIFLFFLALLIFGPKKLPEIGRRVGKVLNDFKRASNEFKAQIESEIAQIDRENQRKQWQDKPKNTIMLPTTAPEGTVSTGSTAETAALPAEPTAVNQPETAEAKVTNANA